MSRYRPLGSVHEALQRIQAIHPLSKRGAHSNAMLFDNRQRFAENSESRELHTWKQSPCD